MLEKDLAGVGAVAFTSDGWQASNNKCFLAVTAHYITEHFEYKSLLLECQGYKGAHNAKIIGEHLESVINEYPALADPTIRKIMTVDGASNMGKAIDDCHLFAEKIVCVAHMLNNSIQEAVKKHPTVNDAVSSFKALSKLLHKSTVNLDILEEYCNETRGTIIIII